MRRGILIAQLGNDEAGSLVSSLESRGKGKKNFTKRKRYNTPLTERASSFSKIKRPISIRLVVWWALLMMRSCSSGSARCSRFAFSLPWRSAWRGGSEQNKCWPWFHFTRHQVPFLSSLLAAVKRKKKNRDRFWITARLYFFSFFFYSFSQQQQQQQMEQGGIKVDCGTHFHRGCWLFSTKNRVQGITAKKIKKKKRNSSSTFA